MEHVWANNATSRLAYATPAGSSTVTVETLDGEKFPSPSGGQFFMVTVEDRRTGQIEIMRCTSRSGDVLTVVRAQENTPAQSFLVGATVSNRLTAGTLTDMVDFVNSAPGYSEEEADERFVNVAGDTMTGPLTLHGNPVATYMAATKNYVDMGLDGKASLHHTHPISDIVGLQAELDTIIGDAPFDSQTYGRQSGAWVVAVSHQEFTDAGIAIQGRLTSIDQALLALDNRVTALENVTLNDAPDDGVIYGRQSKVWAAVPPGTSGILISDTPPIVPGPGYLWLESNTAIMYARIRDIDSEQWVQVNNPPSIGQESQGIADAPADGNLYGRQNNAWETVALEGFVGEAPIDGTPYNRQDAGWVPASVPLPPIPEAPVDGQTYTRGNEQWQALTWNAIPGRPPTFPPSAHTHVIADTTGLQTALDAKEPKITAGLAGQYWNGLKQWTALPTPAIAADAPSDGQDWVRINGAWGPMNWTNLDGKPLMFPPSGHTHPISEVVNLTSSLAAKEPTIAPGDATQYWRGDKSWQTLPPPGISDAPSDGLLYGRKDAAWIVAGISFPEAPADGQNYFRKGSTASWIAGTWANVAGKPTTFPPSAHTHTYVDITDLNVPLATKENTIAPGSINDFWRGDKTWQPTPVSFPEAPTDGLSYLRKGSTHIWEVGLTAVQGDSRYLPTSGGTLTGDLQIVKATPIITLDKAASAQSSTILGRKTGASRWALHIGDNVAEAGSNAGSNFKLEAYTDAGTVLGTAFEIARSTQILDFKRTPTVNGAPMIGGATISDTPPATPVAGQFWWESDSGSLLLRYTDANSSQWVQVNSASLPDAPDDGKTYARKSKAWFDISATLAGSLPLSGGTMTGQLTARGSVGAISQTTGTYGIEVVTAGGTGDAAYIAFHRPGAFACHFGLDTDNQLAYGGWSFGAARRVLWDTGNFNPASYAPVGGVSGNWIVGSATISTDGNIYCVWAGDWISNVIGGKAPIGGVGGAWNSGPSTATGGGYAVTGVSPATGGCLGYAPGNAQYGVVGYAGGLSFFGNGRITGNEELQCNAYVRSMASSLIAVGHATTASAANCQISTGGVIQRYTSSEAFKSAIEPMLADYADRVLELQPIFFRPGPGTVDRQDWSRFGFSAEQCHSIDPRYATSSRKILRDENGRQILERAPQLRPNPEHIAWIATPADERGPEPEPDIMSNELTGEVIFEGDENNLEQINIDLNAIVAGLLDVVRRQGDRIAALEAASAL